MYIFYLVGTHLSVYDRAKIKAAAGNFADICFCDKVYTNFFLQSLIWATEDGGGCVEKRSGTEWHESHFFFYASALCLFLRGQSWAPQHTVDCSVT